MAMLPACIPRPQRSPVTMTPALLFRPSISSVFENSIRLTLHASIGSDDGKSKKPKKLTCARYYTILVLVPLSAQWQITSMPPTNKQASKNTKTPRAGEKAQWAKALATQAQGPKFRSQYYVKGIGRTVPLRYGRWKQKDSTTRSQLNEVETERTGHPLPPSGLHISLYTQGEKERERERKGGKKRERENKNKWEQSWAFNPRISMISRSAWST